MEDWKKQAHARSQQNPTGPAPIMPASAAMSPLARAAQGL